MTALLLTQTLPAGYWPLEKSQPIIDKTQTIHLSVTSQIIGGRTKGCGEADRSRTDLSEALTRNSDTRSLSSYRALEQLDKRSGSDARNAKPLDRYPSESGSQSPRRLENKREAFLPVDPTKPGKNVYPWGITKEEIEQALASPGGQPNKREKVLDLRSVVRLVNAKNLQSDIATLNKYPSVADLHPGLLAELQRLSSSGPRRTDVYAVPYAVAYAMS
jgi:hypothetical protein